ncbi:MAG: F-box protein [Alphaproteobacteria bacterium]|nr:F-box protein [Alphaproteobacteria bacterium]
MISKLRSVWISTLALGLSIGGQAVECSGKKEEALNPPPSLSVATSPASSPDSYPFEEWDTALLANGVFGYVTPFDLGHIAQVCRAWNQVLDKNPQVWEIVSRPFHRDYGSVKTWNKENVVAHVLRMRLNMLQNADDALGFIKKFATWPIFKNPTRCSARFSSYLSHLLGAMYKEGSNTFRPTMRYVTPLSLHMLLFNCLNYDSMPYSLPSCIRSEDENNVSFEKGLNENSSKSLVSDVEHNIIELLASHHDPRAMMMKLMGLRKGMYAYKKDVLAARLILEELWQEPEVSAGAFEVTLDWMLDFQRRVPQSLNRQFEREESVDDVALLADFEVLSHASLINYGMSFDFINDVLEYGVSQGSDVAISDRLEELSGGPWALHSGASPTVVAFIEELVAGNIEDGMELKFKGLLFEKYGYKRDVQAAIDFVVDSFDQHNPVTVRDLAKGYVYDSFPDDPVLGGQYGLYNKGLSNIIFDGVFEQNHPTLTQMYIDVLVSKYLKDPHRIIKINKEIESLASRGIRFARYLKAFGLLHGLFGFGKNIEEARKYILEHYIAF